MSIENTEVKIIPIHKLIPADKIKAIEEDIKSLENGATITRIDTESQLLAANELLATVEKRRRKIEALRVEYIAPHSYNIDVINEYMKAFTNDNKKKPGSLDTLKASISSAIMDYNNRQKIKTEEEARQRLIEQQKIEETARLKREEEDRKRQEAEAAILRAQQAANEEDRKKAEAEALKLQKQANKLAEQADKKDMQAQVVRSTPVQSAPVKVEGVSVRSTYSANVKDQKAFFEWIASTGNFFLVTINQSALNKKASTEKDYFIVPGCELVKTDTLVKRV
jgi:hypothetical protein